MDSARVWDSYCGIAPVPAEILLRWNLDPLLIASLLIAGWLYLRADPSPQSQGRFAVAWVVCLLLFVSPLCALSVALFSVRVAHHTLLVAVIAPLLVWALPRSRLAIGLGWWTAAQAIVLWLWHAPPIYALALSNDAIFWAMQLSLLGSAFGFWAAVRRAPEPAAVAALLITMVQMGLLGALITFAGSPLYAPHLLTTAAWGYSPIEDQQLAGMIMWVPASAIYLSAALFLIGRWIKRAEAASPSPC